MISTIVGTFGAGEDSIKVLNRGLKLHRRHSHHIFTQSFSCRTSPVDVAREFLLTSKRIFAGIGA